jgi:hypothetical protein
VQPQVQALDQWAEVVVDQRGPQFLQQGGLVGYEPDAGQVERRDRVGGQHRDGRVGQAGAQERLVVGVPDEHLGRLHQRHPAGGGVSEDGRQGDPVRVAFPGQGGRDVGGGVPAPAGGGEHVVERVAVHDRVGAGPAVVSVRVEPPHEPVDGVVPAHRREGADDRGER